jgi:hypothetical protein
MAFSCNIAIAATGADTSAHSATPKAKAATVAPADHPGEIPADTNLINNANVLDVLNTDMYTFLQVTSEMGPQWIAVAKTDIPKGAKIKFSNGMVMNKFHSKALDRTFEVIYFIDTIELVKD